MEKEKNEKKVSTTKAIKKEKVIKEKDQSKTYYDLTDSELKTYLSEFKKTPGGTTINLISNIFYFVIIIFTLCVIMLTLLSMSYDKDFNVIVSIVEFTILFISVCVVYIYQNISFSSWLKNKYNIKRW